MAASTVLNYLPRKSVVHELTGTTKLVFFLLFTFASMITYDIRVLVILMAVSGEREKSDYRQLHTMHMFHHCNG